MNYMLYKIHSRFTSNILMAKKVDILNNFDIFSLFWPLCAASLTRVIVVTMRLWAKVEQTRNCSAVGVLKWQLKTKIATWISTTCYGTPSYIYVCIGPEDGEGVKYPLPLPQIIFLGEKSYFYCIKIRRCPFYRKI
jgi:hypothetical protein